MPRGIRFLTCVAGLVAAGVWAMPVNAQVDENFNTVTETGGGQFMDGTGSETTDNWDDGISGEKAFGATEGFVQIQAAAEGDATAGVNGTGAGVISAVATEAPILAEDFEAGAAAGPFIILDGTGATSDAFNLLTNYDDNLVGEQAYGGTYGGAALNGDMVAEVLATGGVGVGKAARLDVANVTPNAGGWYAGLQWLMGPLPGAAPGLSNGGFENGLDGWATFNQAWAGTDYVRTGTGAAFVTGPGFQGWDASGMWQGIPVQPGDDIEFSLYGIIPASDPIEGGSFFTVSIVFFDASGTEILGSQAPALLDVNSTTEEWTLCSWQATAPPAAATVRGYIYFIQQPQMGGTVWIDDAKLGIAGGGEQLDLDAIELTAQLKGLADAAGESLGDVELRIEDSAGARLVFPATATTNWQSIGGALSSAQERDASNNPATGVFNTQSDSFTVIASFGGSASWGTGGTLFLDDLVLGSTAMANSTWTAGLLWDGQVLPSENLEDMSLTANVMGNVPGGEYSLKLEAVNVIESGVDQDFNAITTNNEVIFFTQETLDGGGNYVFVDNWNEEITGETAYGGMWGNGGEFYDDGVHPSHMAVNSFTNMGVNGGGSAQLYVDGAGYTVDASGWYAGVQWQNQHLASTDLSQVILTADVKGEAAFFDSFVGDYELRIEDMDGDRLVFSEDADGTWQSVGGPLSTATYAPHPEGAGNGVFDLNSPQYTVVVSFGDQLSWAFGGILNIDNVYLTPVVDREVTGSISFEGVADGFFQNIGGLLSDGLSTLVTGSLNEDFEAGTGEGVDFFTGGAGGSPGGWDTGLEGEDAFGGAWGTGVLGLARAESCLDCGVDGSAGARLFASNVTSASDGGWWAGLQWRDQQANISDPAAATLTADIKASANAGGAVGDVVLRIEDSAGNYIAFVAPADGQFHSIGGSLATPDRTGQVDNPVPDAVPNPYRLNLEQGSYAVVLVISGTATEWTAGGTVTVDNLVFAGQGLDADDWQVTVSFENALDTWGANGQLVVDNLRLGEAVGGNPDLDTDGDVDLADYAIFQVCFPADGQITAGCENADIDGDGDIDLSDLVGFVDSVTGL